MARLRLGLFICFCTFTLLGCSVPSALVALGLQSDVPGLTPPSGESPAPSPTPSPPATPAASSVVYADDMSTCVRVAGALFCWGENGHYEKLDGTTTNALSPVAIDEFTSGVTSFETGFDFSWLSSAVALNAGARTHLGSWVTAPRHREPRQWTSSDSPPE